MKTLEQALHEFSAAAGVPIQLWHHKAAVGLIPAAIQPNAYLFSDIERGAYHIRAVSTTDPTNPGAGACITSFAIIQFPGCCGMAISTGVRMYSPFVGRGLNKFGLEVRQAIARLAGYTYLVCSDIEQNERERRTLQRHNWKDIFQFTNKRTKNVVNLSVKYLLE